MIEVKNLVKDYGTVVAVRDVSFRVGRGEVVGFLGPNGAGKSTTLRILAGFLGPTAGQVKINGHDILEEPIEARRSIGYMPEASPLYPEMRVREYLRYRAELKRVRRGDRAAAVDRAMEAAAVADMSETLIGHLSKGYRQRVGLADALVSRPPLLILDEPTAGLDPNQIRDVRNLIRELGDEHTILLSTHILSEVETVCDRAVVIDRGRLIAEGTLDELTSKRQTDAAKLVVTDPDHRAAELLESFGEVAGVDVVAGPADGAQHLSVKLAKQSDVALVERLVARLVEAGVGVREATPIKASLEDVFVELTLAEARARAESKEGAA